MTRDTGPRRDISAAEIIFPIGPREPANTATGHIIISHLKGVASYKRAKSFFKGKLEIEESDGGIWIPTFEPFGVGLHHRALVGIEERFMEFDGSSAHPLYRRAKRIEQMLGAYIKFQTHGTLHHPFRIFIPMSKAAFLQACHDAIDNNRVVDCSRGKVTYPKRNETLHIPKSRRTGGECNL